MTLPTVILGITVVILSAYIAVVCFRTSRRLRENLTKYGEEQNGLMLTLTIVITASGYQLLSEAFLALGTLVFSLGEHFDIIKLWGVNVSTGIRLAMLSVAAVTSIHLCRAIKKI